jgi:hypothetical protein
MKKRQLPPKPFPDYFSHEVMMSLQALPQGDDRTLAILSYTILTGGWFEWEGEQLVACFDDDEEDDGPS